MHDLLLPIYRALDPFFLIYFSIINLVYTILFIIGAIGIFKRVKEVNAEDFTTVLRSNSLPEITFIVPTYNDASSIASSIENLCRITYRYKQIIIVNDGSTDDTFKVLFEKLQLKAIPIFFNQVLLSKPIRGVYRSTTHHEIVLIDKENGEKFDAINAALNACQTAYFAIIDSDTYIEDSEFNALIRPIFSSSRTIAIGAAIKVKDGCEVLGDHIETASFPKNFITAIQAIEYQRSFIMRAGWDQIKENYIISGAFGVFVKDAVVKAGGYGPTIANDMEIIFRLNRVMKATEIPYQIFYLPDPVAWTEVPGTWKALADQRIRWHRGLLECLWFHKSVIFNPKYGLQGMFVHPFLLFFEAFEPLVEIFGYIYILVGWIFGIVSPFFVLAFILITFVFVFIQTLFSIVVEEFSFRKYPSFKTMLMLIVYSLVECLGYRQLTLLWRAKGFTSFFKRYPEIKADTAHLNSSIDQIVKKYKKKV